MVLGDLLDNQVIKLSGLEPMIQKSAELCYFTTFTDDSGYNRDDLNFMELKDQWLNHPEKRDAIVLSGIRFYKMGNDIVKKHVIDLANEIVKCS